MGREVQPDPNQAAISELDYLLSKELSIDRLSRPLGYVFGEQDRSRWQRLREVLSAAPPIPAVPGGLSEGELSALHALMPQLPALPISGPGGYYEANDMHEYATEYARACLASQPVAAGVGEAMVERVRRFADNELREHWTNEYITRILTAALGIAAKGEGNV
jgi:hypothetical protein